MPARCCLVNPLKKRLNKGMKQLGLFQQQLQRNQQISFFAEEPPPVTVHGVGARNGADGITKPEGGTPFEPVAGGEADSQTLNSKHPSHNKSSSDCSKWSNNRYIKRTKQT